ncbi:aminopeptidase N [Microbacterium sp. YY-01]|uniref:aminopeptidase N n=1 Tax=Microbacterium sp. YY-01 TaxID=3421634 RepID=UPI003D1835EC
MSSANLARDETAARSAQVSLRSIRVELDLTTATDPQQPGFRSVTALEIDSTTDTTWVDFIGLAVNEVTVNGTPRPVEWDGARIALTGVSGVSTVVIDATAAYSRSGEGMHRFIDPVDNRTYLYTQYEPADSRRVMACFEQPDMKAPITFTVHAPSGWHVLSNQSASTTDVNGATQTVQFAPTLPISSYITCICAGPYHRVDASHTVGEQTIDLGVLCRASLAEHLDAEEILNVTRQGLDYFTNAFDYDYPWGKYDQIFVPEYNLGAMENPGLVTFTEAYVFRGAATEAQREARANTILHEMAHMWFGDLVTMKWWDDLWLKESFADYMGAHVSAAATRFTEAWVSFANRRKEWAYTQDQLPTTHPIIADITDLEAAKLNFDGITYAKGASVLKQLVAFVGEDAFFAGARTYFRAHEFGTATLNDLLVELEQASGRSLREWAEAWLQRSGVSTLHLETGTDGGLVLCQTDPRPHRLRLGRYALSDGRIVHQNTLDLDIDAERTPIDAEPADLLLINEGDLTYAKVRLGDRSLDTVEQALSTLDDTLARGIIWSSLWNATRDGELSVARYLRIVAAHAPAETHVGILDGVLNHAAYAAREYLADAATALARADWLEAVYRALQGAEAGSGQQLVWARALAHAAAYSDGHIHDIRGWLDGTTPAPEGLPLDADLRWALWTALAARGAAGDAEAQAELQRDNTASGRIAYRRMLAAQPLHEVRDAAVETAWTDTTLSNNELDAVIAGFMAGGRRDLISRHDARYFESIAEVWNTRSIEIARRLVLGLFPNSDSTTLVDTWLELHPDAPAALRRLIIEQRDHLHRKIRVRAAQPGVAVPEVG